MQSRDKADNVLILQLGPVLLKKLPVHVVHQHKYPRSHLARYPEHLPLLFCMFVAECGHQVSYARTLLNVDEQIFVAVKD